MPRQPRDDRQLESPLSPEQRELMFSLAALAKEHDVLEGWQRKAIFQAGRFPEWFVGRFELIPRCLEELLAALPSTEARRIRASVRGIIDVIRAVDVDAPGPTATKRKASPPVPKAKPTSAARAKRTPRAAAANASGDEDPADPIAELLELRGKQLAGRASPPERLRLAETLEERNLPGEALEVAEALFEEFPRNEAVARLVERLSGSASRKTRAGRARQR